MVSACNGARTSSASEKPARPTTSRSQSSSGFKEILLPYLDGSDFRSVRRNRRFVELRAHCFEIRPHHSLHGLDFAAGLAKDVRRMKRLTISGMSRGPTYQASAHPRDLKITPEKRFRRGSAERKNNRGAQRSRSARPKTGGSSPSHAARARDCANRSARRASAGISPCCRCRRPRAASPIAAKHPIEQLAGASHEGTAELIFGFTWTFADHHQPRAWIAFTVDVVAPLDIRSRTCGKRRHSPRLLRATLPAARAPISSTHARSDLLTETARPNATTSHDPSLPSET